MTYKAVVAAISVSACCILAGPAHAQSAVDYCGDPQTAVVSSITSGICPTGTLSLGPGEVRHGAKRPTALLPQMNNRWKVAKKAAAKAGYPLAITSGWRSLATQEYLFKRAVKKNGSVKAASKWVLPPKLSHHPWGVAIDVNYRSGGRPGAKWLETNGYKYGLCRAYKNEWWHFEPLTTPGTKCPKPKTWPTSK
ncbi:MAG: D-alanyl-D-alanine carboxypeptidase family protein [Actinomycetes bacterium]